MKRLRFVIVPLLFGISFSLAQEETVILNFENPSTSTVFEYFGNGAITGLTSITQNPFKTGINTSNTVGQFLRGDSAQAFAGAFSNPNPDQTINLQGANAGRLIYMKVWMPASGPGIVRLKLEEGTGDNWEQEVTVTDREQWIELAFDPTIAFDGVVADGQSYDAVVLFFDFGLINASDTSIYYFDDLVLREPPSSDVTFSVDMNEYPGSVTSVGVSGSFNNFDAASSLLSDSDNDGIWMGTFSSDGGRIDYRFVVNGNEEESFDGTYTCVDIDGSGSWYRFASILDNTVLPTVAFNSCYDREAAVNITFDLSFPSEIVDSSDIYIAGGTEFVEPGPDNPYRLVQGDSSYYLTIERPIGFTSFFTFANGNCPNYTCREDVIGQACADPNNFNDRFLPPVKQDTILIACFGNCEGSGGAGCRPAYTDKRHIQKKAFSIFDDIENGQTILNFDPGFSKEKVIEVFTLDGQSIMIQKIAAQQQRLEIPSSQWPAGIYYIKLATDSQIYTQKMMVVR